MYQERTYRKLISPNLPPPFRVMVKETDLLIHAADGLESHARESILTHRHVIEAYIERFPEFGTTLAPWPTTGPLPEIIRTMSLAGNNAGVGPMAAVAGVIAEYVGHDLLHHTGEVVVENGGDLFIKADQPVSVAIHAGRSPLSMRMGLRIDARPAAVAVCTSSGTVGHSLSLGKADAVCVVSSSAAQADAAATAIANRIRTADNLNEAIAFGRHIHQVSGIVAIIAKKIAMWGALDVVSL